MFVIEVIPLRKGIAVESLSYYSSVEYPTGTLLNVPLRNTTVAGIVTSTKPVGMAKTALRTATFSLKKLEQQKDAGRLPQALIETAIKLSGYIPAHIGSILYALLPPDIRLGMRTYPQMPEHINEEVTVPSILTSTSKERYIAYRSHIRQTFAHRGSVLFIVPTSAAVEQAAELLKSGIEKRVVTFASTHTKRQTESSYAAFEDLSQAKLIIATPNFAFLNRHDITSIIVESSGSQHYIMRTRPYIDVREALKIYAKETGRSIILGDAVPLTEDEYKRREEVYSTFEEHTMRLQFTNNVIVALHPKIEGKAFSLFTDELTETLKRTISNRGHVFLYSARRGLAPIVLCGDCGYIFRCPESGAPYSLLRTRNEGEESRWFYCGTSGRRERAVDICPECESWRLREQGIGIQQVYDYVKKEFPQMEVFLMDHTTANTHAKAKRISKQFYETKKSILIGTNLSLPYLTKPIECSAVVSYEATRSVPTWRADETVLSLLTNLREITTNDVVIQTRSEPDELLTLAIKGLVNQFYDDEIEIRKALSYPPFSTFILLTWRGTKQQAQEIELIVGTHITNQELTFYNNPLSTDTKTMRHGLLRIPASEYPNKELVEQIRNLPPYIKVEINPAKIV